MGITSTLKYSSPFLVLMVALLLQTMMSHVVMAGVQGGLPRDVVPQLVKIPAGNFMVGSDEGERETAYRLDEIAYGHSSTRQQGWYAGELPRQSLDGDAYCMSRTPITNRQYGYFIAATGYRIPQVDRETWASYGLIHPFERTKRFVWRHQRPQAGREEHPVVLVSLADAERYAAWLTEYTDQKWRLPSEMEWEKAMRGTAGNIFPWGNAFDASRLNSADTGPFDTVAVGQYLSGASPFGVLDGAGQVYEWTRTAQGQGRSIVKGGSWDDRGCGVCRPAARHSRPNDLKHILIGFRLVREISLEGGKRLGCQ